MTVSETLLITLCIQNSEDVFAAVLFEHEPMSTEKKSSSVDPCTAEGAFCDQG
jgi:hypothetical protein